MKIFISWSGKRSHRVAIELRNWLPAVIQSIEPYVSSEDINKGSRWGADLASALDNTSYGIICITKENVHSPWLNFEAGAISKSVIKGRVFPFLLDVAQLELNAPIAQFQATQYKRSEILKLLHSINNEARSRTISKNNLEQTFDMCWPRIDIALNEIKQSKVEALPDEITSNHKIEKNISRNINGWWKGAAEDIEVQKHFGEYRQHLQYKSRVHIEQFGSFVKGEALIETDVDFSIGFYGHFLNNEYLQVQWQYPEPNIEGFGIAIVKVLGIGNQMEGSLLFKRLRSDGLALASIVLNKSMNN